MSNQRSIRSGQQPIKGESDASEKKANESVNERDAPPSKKLTIKDALGEQIAMASKRDRSALRKLRDKNH